MDSGRLRGLGATKARLLTLHLQLCEGQGPRVVGGPPRAWHRGAELMCGVILRKPGHPPRQSQQRHISATSQNNGQ